MKGSGIRTMYLFDNSRQGSPLNADAMEWAMHPDPLVHSWRWLQKDKPYCYVFPSDVPPALEVEGTLPGGEYLR